MPNAQFHTAISQPRYLRYFLACGNNKRKAVSLYRANIALSKEMYGVIGVFEIILRNSIDRYMISQRGSRWLEEAVLPEGYLVSTQGCEHSSRSVQEAIKSLGHKCTHDKLIAKLAFSFWTYQFAPKQYLAAGNALLQIYPIRPFGTHQKEIFQSLTKINDIRNRIAHFEPICFEADTVSVARVTRRYNLMLRLLEWLGCDPTKILFGIDRVPKAINNIINTFIT